MATWTEIPNSSIEVGEPIRAVDIRALRDNIEALAEGAPDAPRVLNAALDGGISADKLLTNNAMRDWVLGRTADLGAGAVGTYAFLRISAGGNNNFGTTRAGSQLVPSNAGAGTQTSARSGTWRCLGVCYNTVGNQSTTLWVRIS